MDEKEIFDSIADAVEEPPFFEDAEDDTEADEPSADEEPRLRLEGDQQELCEQFPSLVGKDLSELLNKERYEELRALGLSCQEAFLATAKKLGRTRDNRSHLGTSMPKSVHAPSSGISPSELLEARELFGGISDEEIKRLYKRVTTKQR